ncbi:G5 domain-containing protein [Micromonospora sp. NPDC049891]|uniref:G5 domain-containing protein n=1 Tax=Micromonospora sp. NPDC049891 TaxID=3155655 RepID=UPI0033FD9750
MTTPNAFPGQPQPAPPPTWFSRLSPGHRVTMILGGVFMSFVLLCCAGSTFVGALVDEPEPLRTGTAAEESAPAIVATVAPVPDSSTSDGGEVVPATPGDPVPTASGASAPMPTSGDGSAVTESAEPRGITGSPTSAPTPVVRTRSVVEKQTIQHGTRTVQDSSLAEGKRVVRTRGVDGVRTLTYQVTVVDGAQTSKELVSSVVTKKPVTEVVAEGTKPASRCDPNYTPCVPIASDVDCAGGSGNGPAYVTGPVKVIGTDIYDLDRDNDGWGCD